MAFWVTCMPQGGSGAGLWTTVVFPLCFTEPRGLASSFLLGEPVPGGEAADEDNRPKLGVGLHTYEPSTLEGRGGVLVGV